MFGEKLKQLRIEKGLTQAQLAALMDVSKSAVSMYEKGQRVPNDKLLYKLSRFFHVSIDSLLGFEDSLTPAPAPLPFPEKEGIDYDDFTYAMYGETKSLSEEDKQMLLNMARMLKERNKKQ